MVNMNTGHFIQRETRMHFSDNFTLCTRTKLTKACVRGL